MRRTRLLLLLALGLAGASLLVLWPRTPRSTTAEQPLPPPVVKPRQPPLQADAEGYYVPGYSFTVNGFRFTGFSLRPEALVTFAQTTVPCLEAQIGAQSVDRKSTRLNSSHANISYAVFCLKKKKK